MTKTCSVLDYQKVRKPPSIWNRLARTNWKLVVTCVAVALLAAFHMQHRRGDAMLRQAVVKLAADVKIATQQRVQAENNLKAYRDMFAVSINSKQLQRPLRVSGELIIMVAGEVR